MFIRLSRLLITSIVSVVIVCGFACPASANAGTPLMWRGAFHLFIGNFIIGIVEGIIIEKYFAKGSRTASEALMILANYFSLTVGYYILVKVGSIDFIELRLINIYNLKACLILSYVFFYVLTVFLEWPFVYLIVKKQKPSWKSALKVSAIVQCVTYLLLSFFYASASHISVATQTKPDKSLKFIRSVNAQIYYLRTDLVVMRMNLDGSDKRVFYRKSLHGVHHYIFWPLCLVKDTRNNKWELMIGDKNLGVAAGISKSDIFNNMSDRDCKIQTFPESKKIEIQRGWWPSEGLRLSGAYVNKHIALETPFLHWRVSNEVVLPTNQIVFEMGDQILIYDPKTNRIGLLARGFGPVVVIDDEKELRRFFKRKPKHKAPKPEKRRVF